MVLFHLFDGITFIDHRPQKGHKYEYIWKLFLQKLYLANPFFPLGGLSPFEANSSTCFNTASSSASAARL